MTDPTAVDPPGRSGDAETATHGTLLERYLADAIARLEAGETVDVADLCAAHPHLEQPVRDALSISALIPDLQHGAHARDPLAGEQLGQRYRLEQRIGAGAMGAVYRARDLELGRDVAVKILQAGLFRRGGLDERFAREAEVLATLDHPGVVTVFDRGASVDGVPFLVMRLLTGCSMAAVATEADELGMHKAFAGVGWLVRVLGRTQSPEQSFLRLVARWGAQLASALDAVHDAGIFHRDVKPSNVFITTEFDAVVLDFGIAAWAGGDASLTATGTTLGTPWYMAPEQAAGKVEPSAQQDVYSLGATLYHLLGGRPPFDGDPGRVLVRVQTEDPQPLGALHPGLPRDLLAIVESCMDRDLRRRYATMAAVERDLNAFLEHRPVSVRPQSALRRWARRVRRAPAPLLATAVVVLLLVLAGIAGVWWRDRVRVEVERLRALLPAQAAIEGKPGERLLMPPAMYGEAMAVMDRILELDPGELPTRLLRAALRLDNGDHAGAAADLDQLSARADSPYLRAVAARYAEADDSRRGCEAVLLDDLPEPVGATDLYVAGFHALRSREPQGMVEADAFLAAAAAEYAPARDLRLLTRLAACQQAPPGDRPSMAYEIIEEASALEQLYGRPTSRTLHGRSVARLVLGDYDAAIEPLEQCIALRPRRHGPLQNLGWLYYRLGAIDKADHYLAAARAVWPTAANTLQTLAWVRSAQGRYDEARALLDEIPSAAGPQWEVLRPYRKAQVCVHEALAAYGDEEREAAIECARASVGWYDSALEAAAGSEAWRARLGRQRRFAQALERGDGAAALELFVSDPANRLETDVDFGNLGTLLEGAGMGEVGAGLARLVHGVWQRRTASAGR